MRFPLSLTTDDGRLHRQERSCPAKRRFPLVLMLEPLHACNLTCTGCGRIREYADDDQGKAHASRNAWQSVDECGAPIVSICGGEPMIYPGDRRAGRARSSTRRKHIYLCTNGMFIKKQLHEFKPTSRFFFNVHLDGLEETHDLAVEREGVFDAAIEGIKAAKAGRLPGLHQHDDLQGNRHRRDRRAVRLPDRAGRRRLHAVAGLRLHGGRRRPTRKGAAEIFMTRDDIRAKFQEAEKLLEQVPHDVVADLPGVPARRARADLHRLGQPDAQRQGLEGPLLPDHRRAPRDLRGPDGQHRLGQATATARTRAASTAWSTAATSRRPPWASTAAWATP